MCGDNTARPFRVAERGKTGDAAAISDLNTLIDLATRAADRLLFVHGAGLVKQNGSAFLLITPGGSGKTTLSAALNARGFRLPSDDVVPVALDGSLLHLGTPICVKPGSWLLLEELRPEIDRVPRIQRYNEPVKYLPPIPGADQPASLRVLFFPRHEASSETSWRLLTPEQAFLKIVEAECLIKNLDQRKLDALVGWISSVPAYSIVYPDLSSAVRLVNQLVGQ